MGGPAKPRRAYSSPVYRSKLDEKAFYIDDSKSLPLFIVKSSPFRAKSAHEQQRRNSQDYESVCFENYEKTSPTQYLDHEGRRVAESKDPMSKTDDVVDDEVGVRQEGSVGALPAEHRTSVVSEATDRCSSSRQIVIDLPDQNKEKPRSPLISEELQKEIDQAAERAKDIPGAEIKSGEEVSSVLDESMQSVAARGVLTYPSFISLSSVNSTQAGEKAPVEDTTSATVDDPIAVDAVDVSIDQSESQEDDLKIITVDIDEDCKAGSEETLTNLVRCPGSIVRRSGRRKTKTAKDIDSFKGAKGKLKQRPTGHIRRSKAGPGDVPIVSDGEYKEKIPPQSLVSIHKDVTSTDSLPKKSKKEKKSAGRKKRELIIGDTMTLDKQNLAGSQGDGIATEDDDAFSFHEPQTMLLDDDDDNDTADSSLVSERTPGGTRTIKKKERVPRISRSGTKGKISTPEQPSEETPDLAETVKLEVMPDEVEEEFVFKQRQEDREKEQLKIEKLEKQIGAADGSLKRLGEKVETLEKETNEQRDREAAERSNQKVEELAKKEEERRAYEEIMKAQEEEYERHLQNILAEEEERKRLYVEKLNKEMEQKDLKRKWALFRQSQNMELRQHVRLAKMKQKLTPPYKYSYFPLLKGTSLNDTNAEPAAKEAKTKKKMGVKKNS